MKKDIKNGARIHQKSSKNGIKKDMKKTYDRLLCQVGPWRPVNLPKINKTHTNNMQEDNIKGRQPEGSLSKESQQPIAQEK